MESQPQSQSSIDQLKIKLDSLQQFAVPNSTLSNEQIVIPINNINNITSAIEQLIKEIEHEQFQLQVNRKQLELDIQAQTQHLELDKKYYA